MVAVAKAGCNGIAHRGRWGAVEWVGVGVGVEVGVGVGVGLGWGWRGGKPMRWPWRTAATHSDGARCRGRVLIAAATDVVET